MCMLCVVPPNVIPSRERLTYSAINNPDGFGFGIAIPSEKRILVEHTMNPDEAVNRFLELREKYPEGHAIWHARLATHGDVGLDNCHPFYVCDDRTILAHNGIISVDIETGDKRSDTRVFAEDILAKIGGVSALGNPQVFNMLEDFISGSKVAVLSVDPISKYECYVLNEDKGERDDSGVWWSNTTYKPSTYTMYRGSAYDEHGGWLSRQNLGDLTSPRSSYDEGGYNLYDSYDGYDGLACVKCKAWIQSPELSDWTCPFCRVCQMCYTHTQNCMCYKESEWNKTQDGMEHASWVGEPTQDITDVLLKRFAKNEMPSKKFLASLADTPVRWELSKDGSLNVYALDADF